MKTLIKILIGIAAFILVIVLIAGYFGIIPGVSKIFGSDRPVNLGTKYTQADYHNVIVKSGVQYQGYVTTVWLDKSQLSFGPPKALNSDFTASEVTARMNEYPEPVDDPLKDVQVRFNQDGTVEGSGILLLENLVSYAVRRGYTGGDFFTESILQKVLEDIRKTPLVSKEMPFYAKGTAKISNGQLTFNLSSVKIGRLPISASMVEENKDQIISYFNRRVNGVPGLKINNAGIVGGKLHIDGSVPSTIGPK